MNDKQHIRAAVRSARKTRGLREATTAHDRTGLTRQLVRTAQHLGATRIACFASVRQEPDTGPFLEWANSQGIEMILPRAQPDGQLEWAQLTVEPLRRGMFGIPEPAGPALPTGALAFVDVIFVPAAAVARDGARLGWGLGYYDRELASLRQFDSPPPVIAVVFESEIFDRLPAEPHDVPVEAAVSELHAHYFS